MYHFISLYVAFLDGVPYDFNLEEESKTFLAAVDHHFVKICQYVFITHVCHFANELQGYVHEQTDIFNVADAIRYVSIPIRNS